LASLTNGDIVDVLVMPESVRIMQAGQSSNVNEFHGSLRSLDFFGPFARAEVEAGGVRIPITMLSHDAERVTEGELVRVAIAPEGLHAYVDERA